VTHGFLVGWLTVALLSGLAIVSPGPNYAVTLKYSLLHSRRAGIWSAVGVAGGNLVHVVLSLLGLAVVVSQSVLLLSTLKWVGTAYLVYLGLKSLRAGKYEADGTEQTGGTEGSGGKSAGRVLRSSFLVSTLNPKVTLFYLVLFTQVVEPGTPASVRVVYGLTAVALSFGWYTLVALLVSHGAIKDRFRAVAHWVDRATGAMLVGMGIKLALSRASS
jgi:RhtB (resistance to homoserine/threonine) family protein